MFEGVTERVVGAVVEFPVRIAEVLVVGDIAGRRVQLGALYRQELPGDAGIVAGELGDEGQAGVFIHVPGQAGRKVVALVRNMVGWRATVAHHAADAVEELALVVDPAGAVEVDLAVVVAASLRFDLVGAFGLRATADHVEHAAWRGLAVDGRSRATQHSDSLKVPRFDLGVGERALWQRQAIKELGRIEAADPQPVGAGVGGVAAALHACGVTQGVVEVEDLAIIQLLAGDDRHRARDFDDRGVGLGTCSAAGSGETGGRAPGTFIIAGGVDAGFRQRQATFGRRDQAVGARAALLQLQTGAPQCRLQGAHAAVLAADRCRGATAGQARVQGQGDAGLAGDLVQGARQRCGRQVVTVQAGLLGGHQRAAHHGGGQGNGDGQQAGAQEGLENAGHAATPRRISAN
ncbi:hypothetical protein D3C77_194340 [compost metagenome]